MWPCTSRGRGDADEQAALWLVGICKRYHPPLSHSLRTGKSPARDLHQPDLSGMPHGSGTPTDPVADAALRELPEINRREMEAVRQAIAETLTLDTGQERIQVIRCVFWDKTHTLEGAALKLHISYVTARRWHGEFI